jgi:hypothetical protein
MLQGGVHKVTVRNIGTKPYSGRDFDLTPLDSDPGHTMLVSEKRATALLADYPGRFELCETAADGRANTAPPSGAQGPPAVLHRRRKKAK